MRKLLLALILICASPAIIPAQMEGWETYAENYDKADKLLNEVWRVAIQRIEASTLEPSIKAKWIDQQKLAQRAWITFRDADAEVIEYSWYGGHGMSLAKLGWKQRLTEERIAQLREQYNIK